MLRTALLIVVLMSESIAGAQERAPSDVGKSKKKPAEAAAPLAPPAGPDSTTETFGDWSIVCATPNGGAGARACEVNTAIVLRGQTAPFARLALVRPDKEKPARLIALVPVNVSVELPVKIGVGQGKIEIDLPFKSCVPAGCVAESEISKDQIHALRASPGKAAGQLSLVDASGKAAALQFSLRGLDMAIDAYFKMQEK